MTPNLNTAGIVDLGAIKAQQEAQRAVAQGASFVTTMTMSNASEIITASQKHVVIVEFYSERAGAQDFSQDLSDLTNQAAGAWLLARVDVDDPDNAPIAQQFGVRAVPTLMAILGGQVAPLWEGTVDKSDAAAQLAQVMQVAAQAGVTGRAQPVELPAGEKKTDPRFATADDLIEAGDWVGARAEFDRLLNQYPADPDILAGRASVGLLARTIGLDAETVIATAQAEPSNTEAQLCAADIEMQLGRQVSAYARLIAVIRSVTGTERDQVRERLLELFEVEGNTPEVLAARRDLMTALF
ncbi:MAG: tetratricopeptide repeat protein [Propionibacteriaceae bacterium]